MWGRLYHRIMPDFIYAALQFFEMSEEKRAQYLPHPAAGVPGHGEPSHFSLSMPTPSVLTSSWGFPGPQTTRWKVPSFFLLVCVIFLFPSVPPTTTHPTNPTKTPPTHFGGTSLRSRFLSHQSSRGGWWVRGGVGVGIHRPSCPSGGPDLFCLFRSNSFGIIFGLAGSHNPPPPQVGGGGGGQTPAPFMRPPGGGSSVFPTHHLHLHLHPLFGRRVILYTCSKHVFKTRARNTCPKHVRKTRVQNTRPFPLFRNTLQTSDHKGSNR